MATVMESHVFGGHLWDFVNDGKNSEQKSLPLQLQGSSCLQKNELLGSGRDGI